MADIRRLTPPEWPLLREVRLRALRDAPDAFASTFAEEVDRPDEWWMNSVGQLAWFVGEHRGRVVGLAAGLPTEAQRDQGGRPELISMWVEPAHRGTEVADALLGAVVSWAARQGAAEIALHVADGNERARRFYEEAGFVLTAESQPLRSRPELCTRQMVMQISDTGA